MPINGIIFLFLSVFFSQSVSASDVDYSYPIQNKNQLGFDVVYVTDESGISVLDFTGDYSRQVNGQYNAAARQAVLNELYNHVEDDFDFVVIFTDFPVESGEAAAFYGALKNDVDIKALQRALQDFPDSTVLNVIHLKINKVEENETDIYAVMVAAEFRNLKNELSSHRLRAFFKSLAKKINHKSYTKAQL